MRAIEIISSLREKYSNKYIRSPENNKGHYIQWLQDEYAELAMKQANGTKKEINDILLKMQNNNIDVGEAANQLLNLLGNANIENISYDIAYYALHKYPEDEDMRKFRIYIEDKIKQYVASRNIQIS
jgi:hypothetical protein